MTLGDPSTQALPDAAGHGRMARPMRVHPVAGFTHGAVAVEAAVQAAGGRIGEHGIDVRATGPRPTAPRPGLGPA